MTDEETDERPEECTCGPTAGGEPLACFECYMAGFETPADVDEETHETHRPPTEIDVRRDAHLRGEETPVQVDLTDGDLHVSAVLTDAETADLGCQLADAVDPLRLVEGDGDDAGE